MDLLWTVVPAVLLCAAAENVTEVKGELGENATLTCSLNNGDILWYMEVHSRLRAAIGRLYSLEPTYYSPDFENKFTMVENRLVVRNVTADDWRLYLCGRKSKDFRNMDSIRLVSDVSSDRKHQQPSTWCRSPVLCVSFSLNAVLVCVFIGLICTLLSLRRKNIREQQDEPSAFTGENPESPQYAEIQLSPPDSIYYKAQFPLATLPP
ncbi:uncharacterized protein [Embiotoca jacksoni]|uniref:uncharacterized protein n=1 Tax=Embiotoca jacksoni TaxID=100190 RepID=UPI003704C2E7